MSDRPNSLLTNSQREKLLDEDREEYTRQHRQRVRERTWNGTKDLSILFKYMEERDIEQVFAPDREAISKTAELIEDIQSDIEHWGRRSSIEYRHTLREITDIIEEVKRLSAERDELEDDLDSLHARNRGISDKDDMKDQRDALEVEIRNVDAHREELLSDLQIQFEEFEESLHSQLESLEQGYKRFDRIPRKELSGVYQRHLDKIEDRMMEERKQSRELLDLIGEVEEELEHDHVPEEDLRYLRDEIEHHAHGRRVRKRNMNRDKLPLHDLLGQFYQELQSELDESEFDPELREDVVRSLAFFLRVSEVLGTPTEDLLEEAYRTMFDQEHPDDVLDHVVVAAEYENRDEVADRAADKPIDEPLSNAELRSLAETDPDTLVERYSKKSDVTEAELAERVEDDPTVLERGMKIMDTDPKNPDSAAVPDMVARDRNDQIVVMVFDTSLTDLNGVSDRVLQLIQDYGGEDRVRGMLVVPESAAEFEDVSGLGDPIDVRTVPVNG